ncbi:cytochrome-c peroxidase [Confluentibacter flavum]|uniref:Methylamine utilization protein n=1 Tax=Confluentibacter flavum TaxID=1909700 RepID=A0A2N3HPM4_9FLAO|nr:cytochrome c peroxidase [Confluentibacter flavum]PKQ46814.1 methylamine utilization protein [Confluentibacter flavum]
MIKKTHVLIVCLFSFLIFSCKQENSTTQQLSAIDGLTLSYKQDLKYCISYLDSLVNSSSNKEIALQHYLSARDYFKKCEPILAFADSENYKALNQPNILKVEEEDATDIKIKEPFGFQVIEEALFDESLSTLELNRICEKTKNRLELVYKTTNLKLKDYHVLWLIRDEINRIALTGITGFDSPVLERSLEEAIISYKGIKEILTIYKDHFKSEKVYDSWSTEIDNTIQTLNGTFETFNRYSFIKNHTHRQLTLILDSKEDWGTDFPYQLAFKDNVVSLFSKNTFNLEYFASEKFDTISPEKVKLGEKLFNEKALSKNNTISCATCHQADKYFTDGKKIASGVTRNSPTLLYAALQQKFFYDNRAGNLEGQIVSVVNNANEFHTDLKHLETVVKNNAEYKEAFSKIYKDSITQNQVRNAIATFIRSLTPFNSKFDKNINGLENTLTTSEINGFNIFMGKGKCATCHFPPLFNGTVPVTYKESEMELIGVPKTNDTINAEIDNDLGRFLVFGTKQKKHFFKTPTIRNIEKTAPYMHNGVFNTLEEVVDFYNKGGGAGLGIDSEFQTLPPDELNLNKQEVSELVVFMKTLTDSLSINKKT